MHGRAPICVVAFSLVVSCQAEKSAAPAVPLGRFALIAQNDSSLPQREVVVIQCDLWLVGGSLSINPDRSFVLAFRDSTDCSRVGGPASAKWDSAGGRYVVEDDSLTLTVAAEATRTAESTSVIRAPAYVAHRAGEGLRLQAAYPAGYATPEPAAVYGFLRTGP